MKKNLLVTMLMVLVATIGMAQTTAWYKTLTTADGLPGVKDEEYGQLTYTTEMFKFETPVSKVRITVISTNVVDVQKTGITGTTGGNGPGFPYFAFSELEVRKANGKRMGYNATSNAASINSGGAIENMFDADYGSCFLTTTYMGECPQAYHYVELEFDEPLTEFMLRWHSRLDGTSMPTHVGITLGTEYLPYPEQQFTLGEKVTKAEDLKNGGFYIIEGHAPEYLHSFTGTKRTYPGGGFWHSPYGGHVVPNAASAVYFIPVEGKTDTYKICWLNSGRFIADMDPAFRLESTPIDMESEAAGIKFSPCDTVAGDFLLTMRDTLIIGHDALGKMRLAEYKEDKMTFSYPVTWNFTVYKANMSPAATNFLLVKAIDRVQSYIDAYGYNEDQDNGEYEKITTLINKAKAMLTSDETTTADIVNTRNEIYNTLPEYAALAIYHYSDSIQRIAELFEEGIYQASESPNWVLGTYPKNMLKELMLLSDKSLEQIEEATTMNEIDNLIAMVKEQIDEFWSYKIDEFTTLPIRINGTEDGLPGTYVEDQGQVWQSRVYFFDKEVTSLRLTVFQTSSENKYGKYDYYSLAELKILDVFGNPLNLQPENFSAYSENQIVYEGVKALCDNNYLTYFHSATADGQDANGYDGQVEYPYIDITLPQGITAFSYKQFARTYSIDNFRDMPIKFALGPKGVKVTPDGTSINKIEVDGDEVISVTYYNAVGASSEIPFKGLNIVKKVYANGNVESHKRFIK